MRVLVISHTVFSETESMGKTLSLYFNGFKNSELAQFYVHSQVPTSKICCNYYRVTDLEAIESIFGAKAGVIFREEDIDSTRIDARTDKGVTASMYQKARKRTPMIYFARNLWWKLAHWNNRQFNKWLDSVQPDCVFFASGDYSFMYNIARNIAINRGIPLYVSCMDDFYFYNRNSDSFLGKFQHRFFMKSVHKTMEYATKVFCICDKMSTDYSKLFQKECITVHTPSMLKGPINCNKGSEICYLGNLGYHRYEQLIDIGRTLKKMNLVPNCIDVYSSETRNEILSEMTEENGIRFHGAVGAEQVLKIISKSLAVIHTESFDETIRNAISYSVSTKIADSLASGTCIFAYGPEEVASFQYLRTNSAAICCNSKKLLEKTLEKLIIDSKLRETTIKNALKLAEKNHRVEITPQIIRNAISCE